LSSKVLKKRRGSSVQETKAFPKSQREGLFYDLPSNTGTFQLLRLTNTGAQAAKNKQDKNKKDHPN
jgi:hypothetical protein